MPTHQFCIQRIDHMGLVAGMCKEPGIAKFFDSRIPNPSDDQNISFDETVVAMLMSGLGYIARTLHRFSEFRRPPAVM